MSQLTDLAILDTERIAPVVWNAIRAYQRVIGDPVNPPWETITGPPRDSFIDGAIHGALNGRTPEEQHNNWIKNRRADGWTLGPSKDTVAKTHPNLVPYEELPAAQRRKDLITLALVRALTTPDL